MKKRALFAVLLTILLFSFIVAQDEATDGADSLTDEVAASAQQVEAERINNAYSCLESKVEGNCASLSPDEKLFTLLSIGKCRDEVLADSVSNEYWTSANPSVKTTALAIIALSKSTTVDTNAAENWLLTRQASPEDVDWYLQIEQLGIENTTCVVSYDGSSYTIKVDEDRTINKDAGDCLDLSQDDYWLKVSPACYDREFEISCDEDFLTALIFRRDVSSETLHVSDDTHTASAGGRTTEKVNAVCFQQDGKCDYESSLWAALALYHKGYSMDSYLPYLTTQVEENPQYLPEMFLYSITGNSDYRVELLSKQKSNKYWDQYSDKFYSTALALYSISDNRPEKVQAKDWLLDPQVQDADGCWQGNVRNTAFILASIWPQRVEVSKESCDGSGYYCMAEGVCTGSLLPNYDCQGVLRCCSEPKPILTCSEQTGTICPVGEDCAGGSVVDAKDPATGEKCCVGGTCEIPKVESECETYGGVCRTFECSSGEEEAYYACEWDTDICCVTSTTSDSDGGGIGWIILLIILILLTVLGIVFRKKLQGLWNKMMKKGPSPAGQQGPGGMPGFPGPPGRPGGMPPQSRRPPPRRILPPGQRGSVRMTEPDSESYKEVDKVLKKLKKKVNK